MITGKDLYTVLTAVIPLYVAMILAYGSVRWWRIFSPDQCSGINRFVAIFAVPLLSFHFISTNDPYAMNFRFIAADTLQKIIMLVALTIWANFTKNGSLEWMITIFSLSTLPNTLVMGIPLLQAMYGGNSGSLMVQVVVMQCIIWYTLLLFLFEYRGAKILIMEQFPETAASIVSFKVDSDVVSLDGRDFLETDAEIGNDGKLHVTVRKSNASRRSLGPCSLPALTPRPSNLTGAEIYSLSSSRNPTPRGSNFNHSDFYSLMGYQGRHSNFGQPELYSVQSSRGPTPRPSNFEESSAVPTANSPKFGFYPAPNPEFTKSGKTQPLQQQQQPPPQNGGPTSKASHDAKELHMFVWSSSASPVSETDGLHVFNGNDEQIGRSDQNAKEIRMFIADHPQNGEKKVAESEGKFIGEELNFQRRVEVDNEKEGRKWSFIFFNPKMSSSLTCSRLTLFTVAAVAFQIIGLSFFVFGFFPVKPALSGDSGSESFRAPTCYSMGNESERDLPPYELQSLYQELSGIPPLFDRLILMVIDGLPAEFVLGKDERPPIKALMEAMPYTQSLLANGIAKGYHAKAAPPTVTMPRLKAMVSGAIGGFLDVAFNFNTQALLDDNLLGQFSKLGWRMVMCGDETWLKLFPGFFMRHDGVSSFFVKDTVEVDKNVSRHLSYELSKNDWSLLILHYLGLDHVGHTGGRNSPLMAPKLMEMDEVVKMIHAGAIMNPDDKKRTLLVVVSDHGMTENGNHGGSSYEETDSLLLFIGPKSHATDFPSIISNDVNQVDIAPTLALLFGVPIPKNNVGVMIPGMIDSLKDMQQLRALQLNSWQLLRLLQKQVPGFPCGSFPCDGFSGDQGYNSDDIMEKFCRLFLRAAVLHDSWISTELSRSDSREDKSGIIAAYYEFLINANQWLSHKATDKPSTVIVFGVKSMILSFLIFSTAIYSIIQEIYSGEKQLSNGIFTRHLDEGFSLSVIFILVISMGSSSMVEEEQYIWHYLISTLNMLFLRKTVQFFKKENTCSVFTLFSGHERVCIRASSIFTLLIIGRILRGWHQGGVNWTHLPDISKWLEQSGTDLQLIQLTAVILTIILSLFSLSVLGRRMKIVLVVGFNFLMSGLLVLYHILKYQHNASLPSSNAATSLAQIIYATLGVSTVGTVLAVPWIMPIQISKACSSHRNHKSAVSHPFKIGSQSQYPELRYSLYIIGWVYIGSWCLLQSLLQQPVNAVVTLLILMQIFASFLFFSQGMLQQKQWVEEWLAILRWGIVIL